MTQIGISTYLQSPANIRQILDQAERIAGKRGIKLKFDDKAITQQFRRVATEYQALDRVISRRNNGTGLRELIRANDAAVRSMRIARTSAEEFGKNIAEIGKRFGVFFVLSRSLYAVSGAFSASTKQAIEYDRALSKIAQLTDTSLKGAAVLDDTISKLSRSYGVSAVKIAEVGQVLGEAGRNLVEINSILKAVTPATLLPTFTNLISNIENLEAVLAQFKLPATEAATVLDLLNTASKDFNVTVDELFTGLQRAGSAFASLGGVGSGRSGTEVLKEYISLFTSVISVTRESAEVVGTTFRSVTPRLQRPEVQRQLSNIGVKLTDENNQFVGPFESFRRISGAIKSRGIDPRDRQFAQIVDTVGANRNSARVTAILTQFDRAEKIQELLKTAPGSVQRDAEKVKDGVIQIQLQQLREEFNAFVREIILSGEARKAIQFLTDGLKGLINALDTLAPAIPTLIGLATVVTTIAGLGGVVRGFGKGIGPAARGILGNGFNSGGRVSTVLTPGEKVFSPSQVKQIGIENLEKINKNGGIVPGSGNTDSYYAELPNGSYVLRKSAVKYMAKGGDPSGQQPLNTDDVRELKEFPSTLAGLNQKTQKAVKELVFGLNLTSKEIASVNRSIKVAIANNPLQGISGGKSNFEERLVGELRNEFLPKAPPIPAPLPLGANQPINLRKARERQIRNTQLSVTGDVVQGTKNYIAPLPNLPQPFQYPVGGVSNLEAVRQKAAGTLALTKSLTRQRREEQATENRNIDANRQLYRASAYIEGFDGKRRTPYEGVKPGVPFGRGKALLASLNDDTDTVAVSQGIRKEAVSSGEKSRNQLRPKAELVNQRRLEARRLIANRQANDQIISDTLGLHLRRPKGVFGNPYAGIPLEGDDAPRSTFGQATKLAPDYLKNKINPYRLERFSPTLSGLYSRFSNGGGGGGGGGPPNNPNDPNNPNNLRGNRALFGATLAAGVVGGALSQSKNDRVSAFGTGLAGGAGAAGIAALAVNPVLAALTGLGVGIFTFIKALKQKEKEVLNTKLDTALGKLSDDIFRNSSASNEALAVAKAENAPGFFQKLIESKPSRGLYLGAFAESRSAGLDRKVKFSAGVNEANAREFELRKNAISDFIQKRGEAGGSLNVNDIYKALLDKSVDKEGFKNNLALSTPNVRVNSDGEIVDRDKLAQRVIEDIAAIPIMQAEGVREFNAAIRATEIVLLDFDGKIAKIGAGIDRVSQASTAVNQVINSRLNDINGDTRSRVSQQIVNPFANIRAFSQGEISESLNKVGNTIGVSKNENFNNLRQLSGLDSAINTDLRAKLVKADPTANLEDLLNQEFDKGGTFSGFNKSITELLNKTIKSSIGKFEGITVGNAIAGDNLDKILGGIGGGNLAKSTEVFSSVIQALQTQQDSFIATQNQIDKIGLSLSKDRVSTFQKRSDVQDDIVRAAGLNSNAVLDAKFRVDQDSKLISGRVATDPALILKEIQTLQSRNPADPQINKLIEVLKIMSEETRELAAINQELAEVEAAKNQSGSLIEKLTSSSFEERNQAGLGIQVAKALSEGKEVPLFILNQVKSIVDEISGSDQRVRDALGVSGTGQNLEDAKVRQQVNQGPSDFVRKLAPIAFNAGGERDALLIQSQKAGGKRFDAGEALNQLNSDDLLKQQQALLQSQGEFLVQLGQQFFDQASPLTEKINMAAGSLATASANIPQEIKLSDAVVRVNFMGADMFKTLEPELKNLIERSVKDAMRAQMNPGAGGK